RSGKSLGWPPPNAIAALSVLSRPVTGEPSAVLLIRRSMPFGCPSSDGSPIQPTTNVYGPTARRSCASAAPGAASGSSAPSINNTPARRANQFTLLIAPISCLPKCSFVLSYSTTKLYDQKAPRQTCSGARLELFPS